MSKKIPKVERTYVDEEHVTEKNCEDDIMLMNDEFSAISVDGKLECFEYVYLIQNVFYKNAEGHKICKIGKTTKIHTRFMAYQPGTRVYYVCRVKNCHFVENEIKKVFPKFFCKEDKYGIEYFSGDVDRMIRCIKKIITMGDQEVNESDIYSRLKSFYGNRVIVATDNHSQFDDPCDSVGNDESGDLDDLVRDTGDAVDVVVDTDVKNVLKVSKGDGRCKKNGIRTNVHSFPKAHEPELKGKFSCNNCQKTFTSKRSYDNHINKNICTTGMYSCKYCNRKFQSCSSMYRHMAHSCKIKKNTDNKKDEIFERLRELEEKSRIIEEKTRITEEKTRITAEKRAKRLSKLENENKNLKKKIKKLAKKQNSL